MIELLLDNDLVLNDIMFQLLENGEHYLLSTVLDIQEIVLMILIKKKKELVFQNEFLLEVYQMKLFEIILARNSN
jgi:hypothetical protein